MKLIKNILDDSTKSYYIFRIILFAILCVIAVLSIYFTIYEKEKKVTYDTQIVTKDIKIKIIDQPAKYEEFVYITISGDCYHASSCGHLFSKIPIKIGEAITKGYRLCSHCHGVPTKIQVSEEKNHYEQKTVSYIATVPHTHYENKYDLGGAVGKGSLLGVFAFIIIDGTLFIIPEIINDKKKTTMSNRKQNTSFCNVHKNESHRCNNVDNTTKVEHKRYGIGTVKSRDNNYIVIDFESGEEKKFQYPQAFIDGFLTKVH